MAHTKETIAGAKESIYLGLYAGENSARGRRCLVLGFQFGPLLYCIGAEGESDALDEFDERHGDRVTEEMTEQEFEEQLNNGEIRINSGGTTIHVDHYEWMREFRTFRDAWNHYNK